MLNAILRRIRFVILVLGGYHHVALENAALRQQLAGFKRDLKRPRPRRRDRLFWIGLRTIWKNWKSALVIVRPETVISWQRKRFKRYWWKLSQSKGPGRPRMRSEIRKLIGNMAAANPLWGAPRIHGEFLKLGVEISEQQPIPLVGGTASIDIIAPEVSDRGNFVSASYSGDGNYEQSWGGLALEVY